MKQLIIIFLAFLLLQSCKNETKNSQQNEQEKKSADNSGLTSEIKKITSTVLNANELPNFIKYEGKIVNAVKWTDNLGENIVITTETGIYESKKFKHENDGGDAEIFAYHFIIENNNAKQTWKVYDYISDCPVDIVAEFIDNTFQITDLDNNGVAEIWLMYKTVCHGDVSPSDMKIIMYEGQQKFAIRGENKVMHGIDDDGNEMYMGGEYKIDKAFSDGPKVFLDFAKKLWDNNIIETWKNKH
ncbi:MAG: hypothetical protein HC831_17445 [Chloroflexia bacterium]|nr:hypothetical protein [Chloroflexia bacterium]